MMTVHEGGGAEFAALTHKYCCCRYTYIIMLTSVAVWQRTAIITINMMIKIKMMSLLIRELHAAEQRSKQQLAARFIVLCRSSRPAKHKMRPCSQCDRSNREVSFCVQVYRTCSNFDCDNILKVVLFEELHLSQHRYVIA